MLFEDLTPKGKSFAKDPCVVHLNDRFYLYYSKPVFKDGEMQAYCIGIAQSGDLENWEIIGSFKAEQPAEGNGVCAPGAIVLGNVIHLFYQSYGQFPKDYICHATSTDGVRFDRDPSNPIVMPVGGWNNGRAIDADVTVLNDTLFLYWATRDPLGKIQMLGVSTAPVASGFHRDDFTQRCDASILKPELEWEQLCIEAPATVTRGNKIYMFYAGAYNCAPQQISCAVSEDGIHFTRLSDAPLLAPGPKGSWNACESGHPYLFEHAGEYHLFYQGSDDMGGTWRLSRKRVVFEGDMPRIVD